MTSLWNWGKNMSAFKICLAWYTTKEPYLFIFWSHVWSCKFLCNLHHYCGLVITSVAYVASLRRYSVNKQMSSSLQDHQWIGSKSYTVIVLKINFKTEQAFVWRKCFERNICLFFCCSDFLSEFVLLSQWDNCTLFYSTMPHIIKYRAS